MRVRLGRLSFDAIDALLQRRQLGPTRTDEKLLTCLSARSRWWMTRHLTSMRMV